VHQVCEKIVGLVLKAPKLAQIMLNIGLHELISDTAPSQIFSGTVILAKNPRWSLYRFRSNIKIAIT